jgi:anti-sigma-K factor RskA
MTDRPDIRRGGLGPDDDALAAEYALGLLGSGEARIVELRMLDEPAMRGAVQAWQAHFAGLAEAEVEPVAPPTHLKGAIERVVFGEEAASARTGGSIWQRVGFWRAVSGLTTAVAAVAVGFAILPVIQPPDPGDIPEFPAEGIPPGTILMTHLVPIENSGLGLALTREPNGTLQVNRVAGTPTPGREQQLWLIVEGQDAPVSLGLLEQAPLTTLGPGPEIARLFEAGASVAISDEPLGGSPTGAPTGAILALGTLVPL